MGSGIGCTVLPARFGGMSAVSGMRPLRAVGANLVDTNGVVQRITGTSVGGFQSVLQLDGTWNHPYRTITVGGVVHTGILDRLAQAGFNCVRILICEDVCFPGVKPLGYVNPTLNPDWFAHPHETGSVLDGVQILDSVIAYLGRLGVRVILDMHALAPDGDNTVATKGRWYSTPTRLAAGTSPRTHTKTDRRNEADWIAAWCAVAARYVGNPVVIGADLVNEPYAASWGDGNLETDVCAAYTRCADAVLAVNPDWLVFCEGIYEVANLGPESGGWVGMQWAAGLDRAAAYPVAPALSGRVVYSPHDYGPSIGNWRYFAAADYPLNLTAVWNQMWGYLVKSGAAPVLIGEIGDMIVTGAGGGFETAAKHAQSVQWIDTMMRYVAGKTSTGGTPDVPAGVAGFSWSWFCWSVNGFTGTPGSIANTNLLMGDYDTLNTAVMQYLTPNLAPLMLGPVPVEVTVTLAGAPAQGVSLAWSTRDGTAVAGVHYVAGRGTLAFAPGQIAASVTVSLLPLTAREGGTLSFTVVVSGPGVVASGAVTIAYAGPAGGGRTG
jgi:aryl-phospho-beta-D-glucosidase BglC (GH1 family)